MYSKQQSLTVNDLNDVRNTLHKLPEGPPLAGIVTLGLGMKKVDQKKNNLPQEKGESKRRIGELSVKTWILQKAKNYLLQEIEEQNIRDLIENEVYE